MTWTQPSLIVVAGPTGAGKSSLALDLAKIFNGELINCDSLQLYRGFEIGTAKTPFSERRGIPHHLLDVLEPQMGYSAGDYGRAARSCVAEVTGRGRLPIVVGGTGFYLRALLDGLPVLPPRDEALRQRLQSRPLHRLLSRLEPAAAARIDPNDTQKLLRALEIRILTQASVPPPATAQPLTGYRILQFGLSPDRESLARQIAKRTRQMFASGLIEEVQVLLAQGCTGAEKPFEALGYKQALQVLRQEISVEEAITSTEIGTRQYAKRQWTWFRRDPRIEWIEGFGTQPEVVSSCLARVRDFLD